MRTISPTSSRARTSRARSSKRATRPARLDHPHDIKSDGCAEDLRPRGGKKGSGDTDRAFRWVGEYGDIPPKRSLASRLSLLVFGNGRFSRGARQTPGLSYVWLHS